MNVAPSQVFLNIVFELLSRMTLISFASSELTIKQMMRYTVTVHSNDMPHPAKLSLKQHSFNAGGVGALQDFQIGDTVLPGNSYDGAEGTHVEFFKLLYLYIDSIQIVIVIM